MNKIKKLNIIIIGITIIIIFMIPVILSYSIKDITIWGIVVIYLGAIIGGILTLTGVYWTIKTSNKERQKDLELLYKPSLKCFTTTDKVEPNKEIMVACNSDSYDDSRLIYGNMKLAISNIGRGEMLNVSITNIEISSVANILPNIEGHLLNEEEIEELGVEDTIYITIGTPKNKVNKDISTVYNVSFLLEYNGILKNSKFKSKISFCVTTNNKNRNEIYNIKVINHL
mgnify:CR=1 FL=1